MLEIRNLSAGYPGNPVLNGLSADFPGGKVSILIGPNGCGKSTLLKAISGILPRQGSIGLDGEPLSGLPARDLAKKVAYLPQSRQIPEISVGRLVLHGRFPHLSYPRHYRESDKRIAAQAMELVDIPHLSHRMLSTLSGGQRQKAYIAMALAQDTPVVLLDEPTTFLDISHQLQTLQLARMLARQEKTVVLVLHDLTLALEKADQLVLMEQGKILLSADPDTVFQSGKLQQVFGVAVSRIPTPEGWKYYYI